MRAQMGLLPDGQRLHLHDGPIDIILQAFGDPHEVNASYDAAIARFVNVLDELCSELALLRTPAGPSAPVPTGTISRRMVAAVAPYANRTFITPMAAVAGAVAEDILQVMTLNARLLKAYVNDGGDIALHLEPEQKFNVGMVASAERASVFGNAILNASDGVRGIASSGWRGRSFSLGIADTVTVLAETAAAADAAATVIANAVDLPGHPGIRRAPARSISPDNDLGDLMVTQHVDELALEDTARALDHGVAMAEQLRSDGLIHAAALHLQGETRVVPPSEQYLLLQTRKLDRSLAHA
jgi:uncharacterized protein